MLGIILEPTATCNHFRWAEWLLRTLVDLPLTPVFRAIQVLADCEHASGYVQGFPRQGHFPDITFFAYHGSCLVIKQGFHMVQYPRHPRIPSHELKPRTTSPWSLLLLSHWLPIATCDDGGPKQCVRDCAWPMPFGHKARHDSTRTEVQGLNMTECQHGPWPASS